MTHFRYYIFRWWLSLVDPGPFTYETDCTIRRHHHKTVDSRRGVQPFGVSAPRWKKKSHFGPHIKYHCNTQSQLNLIIFLETLFNFEGEGKGGRETLFEGYIMPPTGGLAHNPGMCPDWESNQRPFVFQAGTQSTDPHQPGQNPIMF